MKIYTAGSRLILGVKSEVAKLLGCGDLMIESAVFSNNADSEWKKFWKTHLLVGEYFRMKRGT